MIQFRLRRSHWMMTVALAAALLAVAAVVGTTTVAVGETLPSTPRLEWVETAASHALDDCTPEEGICLEQCWTRNGTVSQLTGLICCVDSSGTCTRQRAP